MAYSFLTDHHIILIRRHKEVELLVIDLTSSFGRFSSFEDCAVCAFRFPPVKDRWSFALAEIRSDPSYAWTSPSDTFTAFHTTIGQRLIVVILQMVMEEPSGMGSQTSLSFCIPLDILLPYLHGIPTSRRNHEIEWESWGPKGCRMLRSMEPQSSTWLHTVYGSRVVEIDHTRDSADTNPCVSIIDFNQARVRKDLLDARRQLSEGMHLYPTDLRTHTNSDTDRMKVVHGEVGLPAEAPQCPFATGITTSLSCRYGKIPLPIGQVEYEAAMVGEDILILVDEVGAFPIHELRWRGGHYR